MSTRLKAGIAGVTLVDTSSLEGEVTVVDQKGHIELRVYPQSYNAGLTPDQARALARQLDEAADRLEAAE